MYQNAKKQSVEAQHFAPQQKSSLLIIKTFIIAETQNVASLLIKKENYDICQ